MIPEQHKRLFIQNKRIRVLPEYTPENDQDRADLKWLAEDLETKLKALKKCLKPQPVHGS